jgi:hypothetical protein
MLKSLASTIFEGFYLSHIIQFPSAKMFCFLFHPGTSLMNEMVHYCYFIWYYESRIFCLWQIFFKSTRCKKKKTFACYFISLLYSKQSAVETNYSCVICDTTKQPKWHQRQQEMHIFGWWWLTRCGHSLITYGNECIPQGKIIFLYGSLFQEFA